MTKRTLKQWQQIMAAHSEFTGTTKQFCIEHNIHIQTLYSRRHAMGLAISTCSKKANSKKQITTSSPKSQTGQFVQAKVSYAPSSVIICTCIAPLLHHTQCQLLFEPPY